MTSPNTATAPTPVHRIEVRIRPGLPDPRSDAVARDAAALGLPLSRALARRVYLIQGQLDTLDIDVIQRRLLADPVTESASGGASEEAGARTVEVHPLPGVMDPAAQSVRHAVDELFNGRLVQVSTGWRYDLWGIDQEQAVSFVQRALANPAVQQIHSGPWLPASLPQGHEYSLDVRQVPVRELSDDELVRLSREAHLFLSLQEMQVVQAEFRRLGREPTDIEIETIAQTWSEHCVHKTFKSTVRYTGSLEDDPIQWEGRPGHEVEEDDGAVTVTIHNLLKSTVAAATHELIADGVDWTLSVFKDNSGVIEFDDENGVCVKVETHNHPSAIEPYGGAATGAGGCIRDVIGTGLGAKPIANTDVFCVAFPGRWREEESNSKASKNSKESRAEIGASVPFESFEPFELKNLPPGCLHPKRVLTDVVAGVRDYGNRMGIPTLNGAVYFDDRCIGNPLVFCGCVGLIPRDKAHGGAKAGDRIVALGGRTGRDGIHGATFSSAELEHTAADEFSHAVQIGNAIEEKRVLDAILRARDQDPAGPLFTGITDCGAGGFSSAIGEMGSTLGAEVHLDRAPLKYAGLSYTEIWISEAQERMVLSVPAERLPALRAICEEEHVELADLGHFGTPDASLRLFYQGTPVGALPMKFIHEGLPMPTREARWTRVSPALRAPAHPSLSPSALRRGEVAESSRPVRGVHPPSITDSLLALLSHPNIASKHWIIRQYDHEVQGNTILKPLVGPGGRGPGDAAVIEPIPGSGRGVAIACGLQNGIGDPHFGGDPYLMALAAIDECVRNLVSVGADPTRIAILDNFCWPSCDKPENLGALVRAAEGCYDGAKAYRTPFVSGKDSLNNQFKIEDPATGTVTTIEIPPTLLISGVAIVPSISRCTTMDAKRPGNALMLIGATGPHMGGSHYQRLFGLPGQPSQRSQECERVPRTDLSAGPRTARAIAELIRQGLIASCHDCSDGGLLVAAAEMLIASGNCGAGFQPASSPSARSAPTGNPSAPVLGLDMTLDEGMLHQFEAAFAETPSRYLVEVSTGDLQRVRTILSDHGGIFAAVLGHLATHGRLVWERADLDVGVEDLAAAWLKPLDW